jgi:CheY-like chemotaxis protein
MLGGEIHVESQVNKGSIFILYLPVKFQKHFETEEKKIAIKTPVRNEGDEPRKITKHDDDTLNTLRKPGEIEESESIPSFVKEAIFENKKILIVDDDMRNVYVLSKILEERKVNILIGRNGREGVEIVKNNPDINLVLMDIMMPEMDGYTAIREIRADKRFFQLPIIALTAKAMKGDREKCIEAGANEYLSKPVNTEKLLNLLRVWLQK